jgi:fumarylacetoacetate (FAA) hydrolase
MKLVTYLEFGKEQIGLVINNRVYNLKLAASVKSALKMPDNMKDFLKAGPHVMSVAREIDNLIKSGLMGTKSMEMDKLNILAPITRPASLRDGYAFRQHVEAARRNRGVEMIKEFDEYPIFYFNNHRSVIGPGKSIACRIILTNSISNLNGHVSSVKRGLTSKLKKLIAI